jgi:holo-[acyl-carrier protein] synthase
MIVGIGLDIIEVDRIRDVHLRHKDRFTRRVLTDAEYAYVSKFKDPAERLAGRWAAKEAAFKALGTGLAEGMRWRDVEVVRAPSGKPDIQFHGEALRRFKELGATLCHLTITHGNNLAVAQVILEKTGDKG